MRISRVYTRMIHRRGFSTLVLFIDKVVEHDLIHIHTFLRCYYILLYIEVVEPVHACTCVNKAIYSHNSEYGL